MFCLTLALVIRDNIDKNTNTAQWSTTATFTMSGRQIWSMKGQKKKKALACQLEQTLASLRVNRAGTDNTWSIAAPTRTLYKRAIGDHLRTNEIRRCVGTVAVDVVVDAREAKGNRRASGKRSPCFGAAGVNYQSVMTVTTLPTSRNIKKQVSETQSPNEAQLGNPLVTLVEKRKKKT